MTTQTYRLKIARSNSLKLKMQSKFPADVRVESFLSLTKENGVYSFGVDYSKMTPGPVSDPATAYVAIEDKTAGIYREVSLSSLLTSGLDADLQAIAALTGAGVLVRTADDTWTLRAVTGTANEVTVMNGDGVSGNPTVSLPNAITFTGKTVTGGTFQSPAINTPTGIVKGDVGLGNVDNTSDATKNAAVATLTNKTLTSPIMTTPTLGAASATSVNKVTITAPATSATLTIANGATLTASASATVSGTNTGDQTITLTGDVTGTGTGSFVSTIAANAVTNAKAAQMAAYTIKGNATGSTANATDISIPALTQKASPVAADKIMIADSAASNALKYATISSIASAGSVSSIAGNTGAFTLSKGITNSTNDIQLALNNATFQGSPANPTGTTSTTQVMAGLGSTCKITPTYSGRAMVQFQGSAYNSTTGNVLAQIRYGTGTAPSNGAAATGTTAGNIVTATIPSATYRSPMALAAIVTGLTPGTAYWFDLGFAPNTGTGTIENISCSIMEF